MSNKEKMNQYIKSLTKSRLFWGIDEKAIEPLLQGLEARIETYQKGQSVIRIGSEISEIGIVLAGEAHSVKNDPSGKTLILTLIEPGNFAGVLLAASRNRKSPVDVIAISELSVLYILNEKIVHICRRVCQEESECKSQEQLMTNYIDSLAEMALSLHDRIDCLISPTVREKILSYLNKFHKKEDYSFTIPLNRSQMAQYLDVERSALSRELSRMKKDGIIDYYKNSFKLLNPKSSL